MCRLDNLETMLVAILSKVSRKIAREWNVISEHIEKFIASEFTFLHEEQHDFLLFDEDTFSRSRQYFWVITSIGEFIPILDETILRWEEITSWDIWRTLYHERRKVESYTQRLESIKERLKSQRERSTVLRDGVSCIVVLPGE